MNLFSGKLGKNIWGLGTEIVMDELFYPQIPVVDVIETIFSICRDMKSDRLIQEKELEELEAQVSTYSEYCNFHRDTLNKSYELEKKELELIHLVTNKIGMQIEILHILEEGSAKYQMYVEQINRYQKILEKLIDNSGKYFNEKIIEANRIGVAEFNKASEIGKYRVKKSSDKLR